jgi:HNH endonuclease
MKTCTIEGCTRPHKSRGMCDTHYNYFRRTGEIGERRIRPLAERLWAKVDKTPGLGPNGDCWEWRGYVHPTGYGQIAIDNTKGSNTNTNRAAYMVAKGEITDGLWVLHACDNRLCCNPDHLWLGTPKENTQDMIAKGRRRKAWETLRGEDVLQSKLTEETVRAMRAEPPMTFKALGEKYGVTAATANKVILRRTWDHIK